MVHYDARLWHIRPQDWNYLLLIDGLHYVDFRGFLVSSFCWFDSAQDHWRDSQWWDCPDQIVAMSVRNYLNVWLLWEGPVHYGPGMFKKASWAKATRKPENCASPRSLLEFLLNCLSDGVWLRNTSWNKYFASSGCFCLGVLHRNRKLREGLDIQKETEQNNHGNKEEAGLERSHKRNGTLCALVGTG